MQDIDQVTAVGASVIEMAEYVFELSGSPEDFCVQAIGGAVVFGKTNRLVLSAFGWNIDRAYCTDRFAEAFDKAFGGAA